LNHRRWWNLLAIEPGAFPTTLIFFLHTSITQQAQLPLVFFEVATAENRLVSHGKQDSMFRLLFATGFLQENRMGLWGERRMTWTGTNSRKAMNRES
jgi:hypothetical protein